MSEWVAKRFWTEATVGTVAGGFEVLLDGKQLRTPLKSALCVPTRSLAEAIQAEWQAQDGKIAPETMPFTRTANAAIDKVAPQRDEVATLLCAYGETDLICYRAALPDELVARQMAGWDPQITWAQQTFEAGLSVTTGVMPITQPATAIARLRVPVDALSDFELAAFHDLVSLSGSLVLALRVMLRDISVDEAWSLSRIDEIFQQEQWGEDEEAIALAARKYDGFAHAAAFMRLCDAG